MKDDCYWLVIYGILPGKLREQSGDHGVFFFGDKMMDQSGDRIGRLSTKLMVLTS